MTADGSGGEEGLGVARQIGQRPGAPGGTDGAGQLFGGLIDGGGRLFQGPVVEGLPDQEIGQPSNAGGQAAGRGGRRLR